MEPGKRFWNCCARDVAEARCPPPVSEERKRILSARGWDSGLVIRRTEVSADTDTESSSLVVVSPRLLEQALPLCDEDDDESFSDNFFDSLTLS